MRPPKSQVDLFDPKPALEKFHGADAPEEFTKVAPAGRSMKGKVMRSHWKFNRHGQSGAWVSELLPHTAKMIDEIAIMHIKGDVKKIPWVGKSLGDDCRQCGLDGEPAASLDALYEVAALARVQFEEIMTAACPESGVKLMFAPLKGRDRAGAKARDEYKDKTAPCYSWLFDISRALRCARRRTPSSVCTRR